MQYQQELFCGSDHQPRSKKLDVGVSHRTPGKHAALDAFLGKQAGVASVMFRDKTFHIIDCTAGDGESSDFSRNTSPGIIEKHSQWLSGRGVKTNVSLYEKSAKNFAKLKNKTSLYVENQDAMLAPVSWNQDDLLFISNDPNTIESWALPLALNHAPKLTTVFSTLGCNVGGLKRLPIENRRLWFDHVKKQISLAQKWHDVLIVTLDGDAAQWAYLVNSPDKWRDELEKSFIKAFNFYEKGLSMAWHNRDNERFRDITNHLFLTKKELGI